MASSDTYIEKDSSVNDEIDRLRHSATSALLTRRDVIVVASVSCIYGLGSPEEYRDNLLFLQRGEEIDQRAVLRKLVDMHYERNDMNLTRGKFRVRGDTIELHPAYDETAVRIELFGDEIERITVVDPLTGEQIRTLDDLVVYPATHYVAGGRAHAEGHRPHRGRAAGAAGLVREAGQAARGPAPAHAHPVRPRDDAGGRLLQRHRELLGAHRRPERGRAPEHAARLLPRRLPVRDRREPRGRAPAPRPVRGRPQPQGAAHRPRLPAALGGRQPAAALRGVHRAGQPGGVPVGHPVRLRDAGVVPGGRADRAAHRPGRPRGRRAAHQGPDRRPARARSTAASSTTSGCWSPRSPRRWPRTCPTTCSSRACGSATCTPTSTRSSASRSCGPCAWASSTCWSASTCCGRASTCPRCRWWPSSTPTRRASSAARRRSSRPSAGPPATSTAR